MAALMVLMMLAILLAKIAELLFRLIGKVDFDESRSTRYTGFMGALRKKEIVGTGRRRRGKKGQAKRQSHPGAISNTSAEGFGLPSRLSHASFGDQPGYETGYLNTANRTTRLPYGVDGEDENEHIMSAFRSRPQSTAYGPNYYDDGYVPPGSYAAVQPQSPGGFRVVRGGRASDSSPYTVAQPLPPGSAAPPSAIRERSMASLGHNGLSQDPPARPVMPRARASSQSALVEELPPPSPTLPVWQRRMSSLEPSGSLGSHNIDRRLSAPVPLSPSTFPSGAPISSTTRPTMPREQSSSQAQGWRRDSSTGSGFFSSLFRGPTKGDEEEDTWSDSDESDGGQQRNNALRRRWIFGKGRNKITSAEAGVREEAEGYEADPDWGEALVEDDAENDQDAMGEQTSGKGFQVIRRPMPGPRRSGE